MKAYLRDNQAFIALSPVPKKDTKDGLSIFLVGATHTTDILKGKMRYDIPEHIRGKIISVLAMGE